LLAAILLARAPTLSRRRAEILTLIPTIRTQYPLSMLYPTRRIVLATGANAVQKANSHPPGNSNSGASRP